MAAPAAVTTARPKTPRDTPAAGPPAGGGAWAAVLDRARPDLWPAPSPALRTCVVVPVRDEAERLPGLLSALAAQRDAGGRPFSPATVEVLVLVNNSSDGSASVARAAAPAWAHVAETTLGPDEAHVGRARQLLMDAGCARLLAAGRPDGLVCSTDADTRPAPDWLAASVAEADGVDAVGGRALLLPDERRALAPGVRRLYLLELAYRRAVEDLRGLYAPDAWDPTPRHHHHFGASLAVRADAYAAVGGMPARPMHEDIALVHALWAAGRRVRHSARVRVYTSARDQGRASGGLADDVARWTSHAGAGTEPTVEPAAVAERRLAGLAVDRARRPGAPPDLARMDTPPGRPGAAQPITAAIADLRRRVAAVRALSPADRLARAQRLGRESAGGARRLHAPSVVVPSVAASSIVVSP